MRKTQKASSLDITLKTLPAVGQLIDRIARRDRNLADQLRRAATSIALNLAEADGNRAGHRRNRLHTALGSLHETRAALKVAVAFGYVTTQAVDDIDSHLDRVTAMTFCRLHRR